MALSTFSMTTKTVLQYYRYLCRWIFNSHVELIGLVTLGDYSWAHSSLPTADCVEHDGYIKVQLPHQAREMSGYL